MRRVNLDLFLGVVCWVLLLAFLTLVSGCSFFRGSKVEARADYSVFAEDLDVSIVAVGYVRD